MAKPEGREVFKRLVEVSDAVLENFSAGVMTRWGFDYANLKRLKPDIVYCSMAGLGQSGPYREYQTFGPTVQAVAGMVHVTGRPELPPSGWGYSYMDHTGGYYGAMAILAALLHRRRTGEGQHIDLSQTEAAITMTGLSLLDYAVSGRASTRIGNASGDPMMAPHGIYRCKAESDAIGDDEWVAIACESNLQWDALCAATAHLEWREDPRFTSVTSRIKHAEALDALVEGWTRERTKDEAMRTLQSAGVAAGKVQRSIDMMESDPQLKHRNLYPEVDHALLGKHRIDGMPVRMSRSQPEYTTGAPLLGSNNAEVFGDILGMSADEIARLESEQVLW
jgi:crotonobetainyl-CoA:carnitine CoA-transferase CaiB-like acyl-CoA transferase